MDKGAHGSSSFRCSVAQNVSRLEAENGRRQKGSEFMLDKPPMQTGYVSR
jgi:hypothetical protein